MQIRPVIVIPVYNNERTVARVIGGAVVSGLPLIVVNDGSTDASGRILASVAGISLVAFPVNRGKGAALRAAFEKALGEGFTHAITVDADGQHLTDDIGLFVTKIHEDPAALWIGDRLLPVEGSVAQPPHSRFGRRFGAFWYRFYTGLAIRDTQCGLRAYPLAAVAATGCRENRFEYEIEALILAAWRGIPVKSVRVHLLYQAKDERVSHFRPVRDFMRISKVNSRAAVTRIFFPKKLLDAPGLSIREKFVALMKHELRAHASPIKASCSLSLGVFMGIMPIHGFQVVSLVALTFLLRLNRPLALVGVSISSAPLIPFWIAAGIAAGNAVIPSSIAAPVALFFEMHLPGRVLTWIATLPVQGFLAGVVKWFLGSVVLAAGCGLATFVICWPLVRGLQRRGGRVKAEPPSKTEKPELPAI